MEKRYRVEMSEEQFQMYIEAMESYSRFLSGQMGHICSSITSRKFIPYVQDWNDTVEGSKGLSVLRGYLFPELSSGGYHGIGANDQLQRPRQVSYEMYREARHFLAKMEGKSNVYSSKGLNYSGLKETPISEVTQSDIRNEKIQKIVEDESPSMGNPA